jgi:hypothetical protein
MHYTQPIIIRNLNHPKSTKTTEFPAYLATATAIAGMLLTALITVTHETTRNAHAYPLIYDTYLYRNVQLLRHYACVG